MDNKLTVFNNADFGEIRTLEENGTVLFCGIDVATALGYSKPRNALATHCKGALKRGALTDGGIQEMSFIPEGDVNVLSPAASCRRQNALKAGCSMRFFHLSARTAATLPGRKPSAPKN